MNDDVQGATVLALLPFLAGFLVYKLLVRVDDGVWRKRRFAAWGAAIGIVWGLSSLMKEYVGLWYRLDEVVASAAFGIFFTITLMVLLLTVLCGGIGYVIGVVTDRIKGPQVPK